MDEYVVTAFTAKKEGHDDGCAPPTHTWLESSPRDASIAPTNASSASFNKSLYVFAGISLYWSISRIERPVTTYITSRLLYHSHCEYCGVPLVIAQIQLTTDLVTM